MPSTHQPPRTFDVSNPQCDPAGRAVDSSCHLTLAISGRRRSRPSVGIALFGLQSPPLSAKASAMTSLRTSLFFSMSPGWSRIR